MYSSLIKGRADDLVNLCDKTGVPKFMGFLRTEEASLVAAAVANARLKHTFFGGYDDAERVFFGVFPDWCDVDTALFPITALTITFREQDILSHRHFLGTFMSLGITRESVGDILIEKGRAVAFFKTEVADYILSQLKKVSGAGVSAQEGFVVPLPGMSGFEEVTDTVASARLDCVVAALLSVSRSTACDYISQKCVSVNSLCTEKNVKTIVSGDKITVKGKGKFLIESIDTFTKKQRLILKAKKYI